MNGMNDMMFMFMQPPQSYAKRKRFPGSCYFFFNSTPQTHCAAPILFARNHTQYLRQVLCIKLQHVVEQLVRFRSTCSATTRSSYAHFVVRADVSRPSAAILFSISEERPVRELQHNMCCILQTSISITISRGVFTSCPFVLTQGPSLLAFNILRY